MLQEGWAVLKWLLERLPSGVGLPLQDWIKTRALRTELRSLPDRELGKLVAETGLSEHDLEHIGVGHAGPGTLLPQRLAGLGIDPKGLSAVNPALYRDLERLCAKCARAGRCQRDLAKGDAEAGLRDYCLNAYTIKSLLAHQGTGGRRVA
jgi:hypothetical protein